MSGTKEAAAPERETTPALRIGVTTNGNTIGSTGEAPKSSATLADAGLVTVPRSHDGPAGAMYDPPVGRTFRGTIIDDLTAKMAKCASCGDVLPIKVSGNFGGHWINTVLPCPRCTASRSTTPYRETINLQRSLYKTVVDHAELFCNVALYGPPTDFHRALDILVRALEAAGRKIK